MERENTNMDREIVLVIENLLRRLLTRRTFAWPEELQTTTEEKISSASQREAKKRIGNLNQEIALSPTSVIDKVKPRAASWQFEELLDEYIPEDGSTLEEFLEFVSQKESAIQEKIDSLPETQQPKEDLVNRKWVANTLAYEARAANRRKNEARDEKNKLKQELLNQRVKELKATLDEEYGDRFNRLVCQTLDSFEVSGKSIPTDQPKLAYAEETIRNQMLMEIDYASLEEFLSQKILSQKKKKLEGFVRAGIKRFPQNSETALRIAAILFEIDERSTDSVWQESKLQEVIAAGLKGETITLLSMACCINQYDFTGSFSINPNLFAYLENPKLEPVPLIIDELIATKRFFEFYGIGVNFTIFTPDTEYTEVGKFGEVTPELLRNLEVYVLNLREYVSSQDGNTQVFPISSLTGNNPLYREVQARVLEKVTKWKDSDFERKWYEKFEEDQERDFESQTKRKVFPPNIIRRKSLEITRKRWAVMAAEGAVFATFGPNTIFVSQERRARDIIYTADKGGNNFPPVIYILQAAELWNRKIVQKII